MNIMLFQHFESISKPVDNWQNVIFIEIIDLVSFSNCIYHIREKCISKWHCEIKFVPLTKLIIIIVVVVVVVVVIIRLESKVYF